MVILTSEVQELKANPNRAAKGTVIEARLDRTRGPIATLLIQNGTLNQGDVIIAGTAVGRVRVMTNDKGRTVKTAGPSVPVEITGLADVPAPGDEFNAVSDERMARELVEQRRQAEKDAAAQLNTKITLDNLFAMMQEGEMKDLNLIVKADVQGSAEALKASLPEAEQRRGPGQGDPHRRGRRERIRHSSGLHSQRHYHRLQRPSRRRRPGQRPAG